MARFFHNTMRIPHIQNATERVRVIRFFLRGFSMGLLLLQSCIIIIGLLVRFKLGFPIQCSGFPEKIYAPTYTLVSMAAAMWMVLVWGLIKISSLKKSADIKGACAAYLVLNFCQFVVILVSRLHSSGHSNEALLIKYSHVFSNGCLDRIQQKELCCGFQNYTEWLESYSSGEPENNPYGEFLITNVQQSNNGQHMRTLRRKKGGFFLDSVFPKSCWCSGKHSLPCSIVTYKIRPHNETYHTLVDNVKLNLISFNLSEIPLFMSGNLGKNGTVQWNETIQLSDNSSDDLTTKSAAETPSWNLTAKDNTRSRLQGDINLFTTSFHHAHIYTKPCKDSLLDHFKTVDISAAATAVVSSSVSLAVFLFGYFLIHNLEGAVTVSDIYKAPSIGARQGVNSTSPSTREENSPSPTQLEQSHSVIILQSIDKQISSHDITHFQVDQQTVGTQHLPRPIDEKDVQTIFSE